MLTYFAIGLPLGLSAAGQPGPFQAYLLSQSIKKGWLATLPAALAPLLSDGPIIVLMVLILTRFPAWLLSAIKIGGGLFLLYLAWGAYRTFRTYDFEAQAESGVDVAERSVLKAALLNLLNPNPYLYWGGIGGPFLIEGWRQSPGRGVGFLLGFYTTMLGGSAALIVLFGAASQTGPKVSRILSGLSAVLLLAFGAFQLWSGLSGLVA